MRMKTGHFTQLSIIAVGCYCFMLSACNQAPDHSAELKHMNAKLMELEKSSASQQAILTSTRARVTSMGRQLSQLNFSKRAIFDPTEPSYQRVDSSLGAFAVSIENVRTFADGVRVTLNLGNLSSATYSGAQLSLDYGKRMPSLDDSDFDKHFAEWDKSLQKKQVSITSRLKSGHWNPVQVTLPKIAEKDFGYLAVEIETNEISLFK